MSALPFAVRWGAATSQGGRSHNEDALLADTDVFVVADGMGGHDAGEVASATAVEVLRALVGRAPGPDEVRAALVEAHERVRALASEGTRRPGTTATGVALTVHEATVCWVVLNVGDSRTYRMAGAVLEQVTRDHSEVAELVADGVVRPDEAAHHPWRHVVTRALGGGAPTVEPDVDVLAVSPGDRMLVCSDGLTDALPDQRIEADLKAEADPQAAADRLVATAVAAGAADNVTVVVVDAPAVLPR
ncbi:PP2C family serine/threonine-protein phosphatase [Cellulomonas sp. PSBB021]|uniref:PP2C family protein-serine/threonine phosphatase n=1 Tax=Cellulomonas sp. PSBB021 TaxID=2003551 RepID=UPI000B8D90F2|nr:protein phosphatase 2C domain-containing protein [Cellulomonas sp. PSBB021]ASR56875.1 serine/threonine protein phosphatase [Cellulomonas sp. PSBB021]